MSQVMNGNDNEVRRKICPESKMGFERVLKFYHDFSLSIDQSMNQGHLLATCLQPA